MNKENIIIAIITALPPTLVAFFGLLHSKKNSTAINEVHLLVNSRMDELLKTSKAESKEEGKEIGRAEKSM